MNVLDTLNPWGALRRANAYIAELEADVAHLRREYEGGMIWEQMLAKRAKRLEALVAEGHFRNPETGRIGPKGKTFE